MMDVALKLLMPMALEMWKVYLTLGVMDDKLWIGAKTDFHLVVFYITGVVNLDERGFWHKITTKTN